MTRDQAILEFVRSCAGPAFSRSDIRTEAKAILEAKGIYAPAIAPEAAFITMPPEPPEAVLEMFRCLEGCTTPCKGCDDEARASYRLIRQALSAQGRSSE